MATSTCSISPRARRSTGGWRWRWRRWCWAANRESLHRLDPHPCIEVLQDPIVRPSSEGHAVRADLAHADAVAPAFAEERVAIGAVRVFRLLDDEEVVGDV